MKRDELVSKTEEVKQETRDALTLLYEALPPGQQRTVAKSEKLRELLERYGVIQPN